MKKFKVLLNSINDVKGFVNAAGSQMCDIDIVSGRYTVDAKSIMGIFSLDLSKLLPSSFTAATKRRKRLWHLSGITS